eukprot:6837338-Alexandrium_andersonii.AAC.1
MPAIATHFRRCSAPPAEDWTSYSPRTRAIVRQDRMPYNFDLSVLQHHSSRWIHLRFPHLGHRTERLSRGKEARSRAWSEQ